MCWRTEKQELTKNYIAEQDVPIIKYLIKNNDGSIRAPYRDFDYELNKEYSVDNISFIEQILVDPFEGKVIYSWEINEGLHCMSYDLMDLNEWYIESIKRFEHTYNTLYIKPCDSDGWVVQYNTHIPFICKGYIPKGTRYYINECGEVVTEKYILTEEIVVKKINKQWNESIN